MEAIVVSEEFLIGMSQIAIALIGFSGIVTALEHGQGQKWTASELLQLRTQVEPSMCALFGGLVPTTVALWNPSFEWLWRTSNALLALFVLVALLAFLNRTRRAPTLWSQRILTVVSVAVLLGMLLSAVNVVKNYQFTFMLGMWLSIVVGVHNFTLLLFRVERDET